LIAGEHEASIKALEAKHQKEIDEFNQRLQALQAQIQQKYNFSIVRP
jgi:hypothetical protein